MNDATQRNTAPFNSPTEIGLRATVTLLEMYPASASLQRLVVYDYLLVHSDDIPDGPKGLHPKTPYRSGELLVRRDSLQRAPALHEQESGLRIVLPVGIRYSATELTGGFIESFDSEYVRELRNRSTWLVERFNEQTDVQLDEFARNHLGEWGAEFESESLLWEDDSNE